ncbi:MAG: DMT family transporter, partial [Anaerolineae bacterium]|nr:DMT family transporter [Anaerolineae bacterium]
MMTSSVALSLLSIAIWSSLAYLGAGLTHVPPLLLVGISLSIGALPGAFRLRSWRVPLRTFAIGVSGIFGYHMLLFLAFQLAPAVEANLLKYLWPLLIVILAPLWLPGYRLRSHHIAGALIGLAGAGLILSGGRFQLDRANLPGYLCAAAAAFTWASYSLLTKRVPAFPSSAVGGFCLLSGVLALALHFTLGSSTQTAVALSGTDWLRLVLLGIGPMGGAFYVWDAAMKRGDPRIVGSLAYLTPLL